MVRILSDNSINLFNFDNDLISAYDRKISRLCKGLKYIKKDISIVKRKACDAEVNEDPNMIALLKEKLLNELQRYNVIVCKILDLENKRDKVVTESLMNYFNSCSIVMRNFG